MKIAADAKYCGIIKLAMNEINPFTTEDTDHVSIGYPTCQYFGFINLVFT